jgi:midasin
MTSFVEWLKNNELGQKCTISLRDYLSWVNFINHMANNVRPDRRVSVSDAIVHGACLAFLDGLGTGNSSSEK